VLKGTAFTATCSYGSCHAHPVQAFCLAFVSLSFVSVLEKEHVTSSIKNKLRERELC